MEIERLIEAALETRMRAYTPYSHFKVGAAILTKDGEIFTGCNIENAAYTPSNCAERTAIFKAISEGKYDFSAIVIVGGPESSKELDYCSPCGVCRQVMREFCGNDFPVILAKSVCEYRMLTLGDLIPESFGPKDLEEIKC